MVVDQPDKVTSRIHAEDTNALLSLCKYVTVSGEYLPKRPLPPS